MDKLNIKQQKIVQIFLEKGKMQSSEVYKEIMRTGQDISLVTIKRALAEMANQGILEVFGSGRATSYVLSSRGRIFIEVDVDQYAVVEPDKRSGLHQYNFDLLSSFPSDIFTDEELKKLEAATIEYKKRTADLPPAIREKGVGTFSY